VRTNVDSAVLNLITGLAFESFRSRGGIYFALMSVYPTLWSRSSFKEQLKHSTELSIQQIYSNEFQASLFSCVLKQPSTPLC